jgi:hypothetical protein
MVDIKIKSILDFHSFNFYIAICYIGKVNGLTT